MKFSHYRCSCIIFRIQGKVFKLFVVRKISNSAPNDPTKGGKYNENISCAGGCADDIFDAVVGANGKCNGTGAELIGKKDF